MSVDFDLGGMSNHQPLQAACLLIQARQAHQFSLDFFPFGKWINEEAVILVDGGNQLTVATRGNPIPITGRNCQAPFGVQRDLGSPTKHD